MDEQKKFKINLDRFYAEILSKYGYEPMALAAPVSPATMESSAYTCMANSMKRKVSIALTKLPEGRWYIQFMMFEIDPDSKNPSKFFSLREYLKQHPITTIVEESKAGQDFGEFVKTYFDQLTEACQTVLRDQISGASFAEHDRFGGR